MARAVAGLLDLPYTELDALQHGPGWVPRPEFEDDVAAMLAAAEAVIWLDHPFPLVAGRLLRRSAVRAVTRRPLDNGNVEQIGSWLRASHPLRIVLSREFAGKRRRTAAELAAARRRGVVVVRLRGVGEERRWLAAQRGAIASR